MGYSYLDDNFFVQNNTAVGSSAGKPAGIERLPKELEGRDITRISDPPMSTVEGRVSMIGERVRKGTLAASNASARTFTAQKNVNGSLARQIEKAVDRRNLRQIASHVKGAQAESVKFKTLDVSVNPVTKLEVQFFVKKGDIPTEGRINLETLQESFLSKFHASAREARGELLAVLRDGMGDIQEILNSKDVELSKEDIDAINNKIVSSKEELMDELDEVEDINKGLKFFNDLQGIMQDQAKGVDIDGLPEKFNKDEVIENLQHLLLKGNIGFEKLLNQEEKIQRMSKSKKKTHKILRTKTGRILKKHPGELQKAKGEAEKSELRANFVLSQIQIVKEKPGSHLNADAIDAIVDSLVEEGVIPNAGNFKAKLTPYLSSMDVMVKNDYDTEVMEKLKEAAKETSAYRPKYAYKTGLENTRELLAQKMLSSVGLDRFVLAKTQQPMEKGVLGKETNPKGIASRWVEGKGFAGPNSPWRNYLIAKKEYSLAKAKGENTFRKYRALTRASHELMQEEGLESIVDNIFIDMIFGANDSHANQYKQGEDGQFYNFDWAQFMHPHFAYRNEGQTIATLRSCMLDHPIAEQSMTNEGLVGYKALRAIKEKIENWDIDGIISHWVETGIVGTSDFFEDQKNSMEALIQNKQFCNRSSTNKDSLLKVAEKYGITLNPEKSEKELRAEISKQLIKLYWRTKEKCLEKIHPKAVEQMRFRMKSMQEYVRSAENPTLKGAWSAYYPELRVFQEVAGRLTVGPGQNMVIQRLKPEEIKQEKREIKNLVETLSTKRSMNLRPQLRLKILRALRKMPERYGKASEGTKEMRELYNAEFLDPKHRYGGDIFPFYQVWYNTSQVSDDFTTWLEKLDNGEDVPGTDQLRKKNLLKPDGKPIEMRTVTYLNAEERKQYRLKKSEDGKWYTDKGGILNSEGDLSHVFVRGTDGHFYVEEYKQGVLNHSSFFSGQPVKGAGRMHFRNGVLVRLKDHSGHYHPTDEMTLDTLRALKEMLGDEVLRNVLVNFIRKEEVMNGMNAIDKLETEERKHAETSVFLRRSLEAIIVQAKKQGVASKEEIEEMKEALRTIRAECASIQEERTVSASL